MKCKIYEEIYGIGLICGAVELDKLAGCATATRNRATAQLRNRATVSAARNRATAQPRNPNNDAQLRNRATAQQDGPVRNCANTQPRNHDDDAQPRNCAAAQPSETEGGTRNRATAQPPRRGGREETGAQRATAQPLRACATAQPRNRHG